jgi:tetratricopeptide (TPR) repeat protein
MAAGNLFRRAKNKPLDREDAMRKAEKLLRQGRLDDALVLYKQVVDQFPEDWTAANALGDLYVRSNSVPEAAEQYTRIAGHFLKDGFLPKAVALYRKVLRIRPEDETSRLRLGEIAADQGLLVDAKAHLTVVRDQPFERGDQRGAMEVVIKLGSLDPTDMESRLAGTRALAEMGERDKAVERMTELADEFTETDQGTEALAALREAARFYPENTNVRGALARAVLARGDVAAAGEYLTREVAGDHPALLAMFLELQLKAGHADVAAQVATQLAASSDERPRVLEVGRRAGPADAAAGFVCFEAVADLLLGAEDWDGATAVLQEFGDVVPHFAPALLRLVEVCVDERLYDAQARLAEAYLHEGRAFEASVISEDLAVREPNVGSHIDRLRRALVMMGECAPDRVIAKRLSEAMAAVGSDQPSSTIETHDRPVEPAASVSPPSPPPVPAQEAVTPAVAAEPPPPPPGGSGDPAARTSRPRGSAPGGSDGPRSPGPGCPRSSGLVGPCGPGAASGAGRRCRIRRVPRGGVAADSGRSGGPAVQTGPDLPRHGDARGGRGGARTGLAVAGAPVPVGRCPRTPLLESQRDRERDVLVRASGRGARAGCRRGAIGDLRSGGSSRTHERERTCAVDLPRVAG